MCIRPFVSVRGVRSVAASIFVVLILFRGWFLRIICFTLIQYPALVFRFGNAKLAMRNFLIAMVVFSFQFVSVRSGVCLFFESLVIWKSSQDLLLAFSYANQLVCGWVWCKSWSGFWMFASCTMWVSFGFLNQILSPFFMLLF